MINEKLTEELQEQITQNRNDIANIIESGNNYIKFIDGTAICWGNKRLKTGTTAQNSQYSVSFSETLPLTFISGTIQGKVISGNPQRKTHVRFNNLIENDNVIGGVLLSDVANYETYIDYLVIGKWK